MASSHRVHFFHLVWSTKGRKDLILNKMQDNLYAYIGGTIRKTGGSLLEIGGIANHLHLLVELSNLDHFTTLIRNTKTASTTWLKEEFSETEKFAWQDGYGSFSVSPSGLEQVREYIRTQEQHHKKYSFEQEYIKLLELHNAKFDKEYIFD
jgi:REP element-mobilizing transposase RayT